jgi:hypothetical protein
MVGGARHLVAGLRRIVHPGAREDQASATCHGSRRASRQEALGLGLRRRTFVQLLGQP